MYNKEKRLRKDSSSIGFGLFFTVVLEIIVFLFVERFLIGRLYLNDHEEVFRKVIDIFSYLLIPPIIFSLILKIKGKDLKNINLMNSKKLGENQAFLL